MKILIFVILCLVNFLNGEQGNNCQQFLYIWFCFCLSYITHRHLKNIVKKLKDLGGAWVADLGDKVIYLGRISCVLVLIFPLQYLQVISWIFWFLLSLETLTLNFRGYSYWHVHMEPDWGQLTGMIRLNWQLKALSYHGLDEHPKLNCFSLIPVTLFIISMTKLLDADWLRWVQLL
jgi:hypothetical protein